MIGAGKSEEVIQRIMRIKEKCICVRGNREKYIIDGIPTKVHDEKEKVSQGQLDKNEWIKSHLSNVSKKFIKSVDKIYNCVYNQVNFLSWGSLVLLCESSLLSFLKRSNFVEKEISLWIGQTHWQ